MLNGADSNDESKSREKVRDVARGAAELLTESNMASMTDERKGSGYQQHLAAVSSFRVPCAVFVFLHHIEGHFGVPDSAFPFRQIVVSFFFVLSGYLLYWIYGNRSSGPGIANFYRKRLARIYPLHITIFVFLFVLFLGRHLKEFAEAPWFFGSKTIAQLLLVQCWYPLREFVLGMNGVTWTLSVIMFCYLLFPFLVRLGRWLIPFFVALVFANIAMVIGISKAGFDNETTFSIVHFFPPYRIIEFVAGMCAARLCVNGLAKFQSDAKWRSRRFLMTVVDVAVLVGVFVAWFELRDVIHEQIRNMDEILVRRTMYRWFSRVGFAVPACMILIWYSFSNGWIAGGLRSRLMVFLGNVSYAFYLCHRPLILRAEEYLSPYGFSTTAAVVICFLLLFVISAVLFFVVEQPLRYWFGGQPRQRDKALTEKAKRMDRHDQWAACGILLAGIAVFTVYQTTWPPRHFLEFESGMTMRINTQVERDGQVNIKYGWVFERPEEANIVVHFLDANNQYIDQEVGLRVMADRDDNRGVRWLRVRPDKHPNVAKIGIACWQKETGLQTITAQDHLIGRLDVGDKYYVIWRSESIVE